MKESKFEVSQEKWHGHSFPVSAEIANKELNRLLDAHGGKLQKEHIVDAAASPASPLHSCFEWDDRKAAVSYRRHRAKNLLACLVSVKLVEGGVIQSRSFVHVEKAGEGYYTTTARALSQEETRDYLINKAMNDMISIRNKWRNLVALSEVVEAMDRVIAKWREEDEPESTGLGEESVA